MMDSVNGNTGVHEICDNCNAVLEPVINSALPQRTVTIIHFNDVYNLESRSQEPVGGAARFVSAVAQLANCNPLVLFSGDAFSPSVST